MDLLLMLAQGDAHVVRVTVPPRLCAPAPAERFQVLERRARRPLVRSLALHRRARVLEARAGRLVLKRYLVGLGERLMLHGGGVYAIEGRHAYVLDPADGGIALRDGDIDEIFEFAPAGTKLVLIS